MQYKFKENLANIDRGLVKIDRTSKSDRLKISSLVVHSLLSILVK